MRRPSRVELALRRAIGRPWRRVLCTYDTQEVRSAHSVALNACDPRGAVEPLELPGSIGAQTHPRSRTFDRKYGTTHANVLLNACVKHSGGSAQATFRSLPAPKLRYARMRAYVDKILRRPPVSKPMAPSSVTINCSTVHGSNASYKLDANAASLRASVARDSNGTFRARTNTTWSQIDVTAAMNARYDKETAVGFELGIGEKRINGVRVSMGKHAENGPRLDLSMRGTHLHADHRSVRAKARDVEIEICEGKPSVSARVSQTMHARVAPGRIEVEREKEPWRMRVAVGNQAMFALAYKRDGRSINLDLGKEALDVNARFDPQVKSHRRRRALTHLHVPYKDGAWNVSFRVACYF